MVVDLYFYREPEEAEKEEQAAKEQVPVKVEVPELDWDRPMLIAPEEPAPATGAIYTPSSNECWATQVQDELDNTAAPAQPVQPNWGGTSDWH